MINLQDQCSLPIIFNTKEENFIFGEDIVYENKERIPLKSLIPGLLNKSLIYPVEVYEEYKNIRTVNDVRFAGSDLIYDILYLPEGLLGVEYIKSHIYYSPNGDSCGNASTIVEILHGSLTILLQRNINKAELEFQKGVEDGVVMFAEKGDKIIIPKGYYYTFINTGEEPVIFSRIYRNKGIVDYYSMQREQGLAYFCIRKNARCEFVKNPRYRVVPELREITPQNTFENRPLSYDIPIYTQLANSVNTFLDLLWC